MSIAVQTEEVAIKLHIISLLPSLQLSAKSTRSSCRRVLEMSPTPPDMTPEVLGEIFEGYAAETYTRKIPLVPMRG